MEFIEAAKELGPLVVFTIVGTMIILSNQRSNTQQSQNTGTALTLAKDTQEIMQALMKTINETLKAIKESTGVVERAVIHSVEENHRLFENLTETLQETLTQAADSASVERIAHRRQLEEQIASVVKLLDTIGVAVESTLTVGELEAFKDQIQKWIMGINSAIIELKELIMVRPTA